MNTFNRRDFLKLTGLVCAAGAGLSAPRAIEYGMELLSDPQIRFGGYLLRGTRRGNILLSGDDGKTWNQLVNLGEAITQLVQRDELIYANLSLESHDFWLKSTDGRKWYTV